MCDQCNEAIRQQKWERLDEVAVDEKTNCWLTRCPHCKQLWETYAYQPHYSWTLTPEEAKKK
jgi:hypothetical protein